MNHLTCLFTKILVVLVAMPLFLGTTFIIRENGVKVGEMIIEDNKTGTEYVDTDQDAMIGGKQHATYLRDLEQERARIAQKKETLVRERERFEKLRADAVSARLAEGKKEGAQISLRKERNQNWGIGKGMSVDQVARIADQKEIAEYPSIEMQQRNGGATGRINYFVNEYRYETENFTHAKKVYFNTNTNKVIDVTHTATPK